MRLRIGIILVVFIALVGFLGYQVELTLPARPPDIKVTYTPLTHPTLLEIGSVRRCS